MMIGCEAWKTYMRNKMYKGVETQFGVLTIHTNQGKICVPYVHGEPNMTRQCSDVMSDINNGDIHET